MALHIFGTILTGRAVAHNNRGENEGTVSTLQKIIRGGELYSTVSGEAIRYAVREAWTTDCPEEMNRTVSHDGSEWKDPKFKGWGKYIDNDVLGYMHPSKDTDSRRGILEIGRAVSTTPWPGTVSNHFASVGAHPRSNENPIPYATEIHDTRYQYTFAMTPAALEGTDVKRKIDRTENTLRTIQNLRRVGGAHARFLYDFAPECVVLRLTHDPAPRIMFCFEEDAERGTLSLKRLADRMKTEKIRIDGIERDIHDVDPTEVWVGGVPKGSEQLKDIRELLAKAGLPEGRVLGGVKAAFESLIADLREKMLPAEQ